MEAGFSDWVQDIWVVSCEKTRTWECAKATVWKSRSGRDFEVGGACGLRCLADSIEQQYKARRKESEALDSMTVVP